MFALLPRHSRVKTQASKLEEGHYPPLYRARRHLSPRRKKRRSQGMEYQPILSVSEPLLVNAPTTTGQKTNHYWFAHGPIVVHTTHLRGTLSYSSTGAPHPPTTKRDTPPIQTKNTAKRSLLRELALGGIWMERSYSPLPVEVVDADLTARTYAIGRTRRADT